MTAYISCPYCSTLVTVPKEANYCPCCGKKIQAKKAKIIPKEYIDPKVVIAIPKPVFRKFTPEEVAFNNNEDRKKLGIYGLDCSCCKFVAGCKEGKMICKKYSNIELHSSEWRICESFKSIGRHCFHCHINHTHFKCPICHKRW